MTNMSRLDVFIARMTAQAKCLNWAAEAITDLPGPVFELGLGNGRTYDHLRKLFPSRDIFVFDFTGKSHPDCIPPEENLILGDVVEGLNKVQSRFKGQVALVHADIGNHDLAANEALGRIISPLLVPLMQPAGIIVSTDKYYVDEWETLELPQGVDGREGFLYRT